MNKAAWMTDIHLNFLYAQGRQLFYDKIIEAKVDCIFISGDVGEALGWRGAPNTADLLCEMTDSCRLPIYFVLGNHDYYHGAVEPIRNTVNALALTHPIYYLTHNAPIKLNDDTILCGVDGWADGLAGNYASSDMILNDSRLIEDLAQANKAGKEALGKKMYELAITDTVSLFTRLHDYLSKNPHPNKIIILTHVPPFEQACLYRGKISNSDSLPFYCNKTLGDRLLDFVKDFPQIDFTVLCGHTHGEAVYEATDNLIVLTGRAEYNDPTIAKIIEL